MMKLANPRASTQTPVMRFCSVEVRRNSAAKRGNIGPIDREDWTATKRKRNWVRITRSSDVSLVYVCILVGSKCRCIHTFPGSRPV